MVKQKYCSMCNEVQHISAFYRMGDTRKPLYDTCGQCRLKLSFEENSKTSYYAKRKAKIFREIKALVVKSKGSE